MPISLPMTIAVQSFGHLSGPSLPPELGVAFFQQPTTHTDFLAQGAGAGSSLHDGLYLGASEDAYYGEVQVQANIQGGRLASVKVVKFPNDRNTSRYINNQAIPILRQEAIQAQDDHVDFVSGATLTSEAFVKSLADALSKAAGSAPQAQTSGA